MEERSLDGIKGVLYYWRYDIQMLHTTDIYMLKRCVRTCPLNIRRKQMDFGFGPSAP